MNDLIQAVSIFSAALAVSRVWRDRGPGLGEGRAWRSRDGGDRASARGGGDDLAHPLCGARDDRRQAIYCLVVALLVLFANPFIK